MIEGTTRVVIGGGLFGCYAALLLADRGHRVTLMEQSNELMTRASLVNQARLHTGLHYPRSILTALESLRYYRLFRERFPTAVRDFSQIYAVARHNSKTSGDDFAAFISRLGVDADEVAPERWFHRGTVSRAFRVEEPSFDASVLRDVLTRELADHPRVSLRLATTVLRGEVLDDGVRVGVGDGTTVTADGVVLATYAATNAIRGLFGLAPLPLAFEQAEVVLGRVSGGLTDYGFTVMDGPFWSLMPFGHGPLASLTSVGLTPIRRANTEPLFPCQSLRTECTPAHLASCTDCPARPITDSSHHRQQMALFLKDAGQFTPTSSLITVKAILKTTEVDDARPTLVRREPLAPVWTVLSGKVSTLFDLEVGLS